MTKHSPAPWHNTGSVFDGNQPAGIFSGTPDGKGGWINSLQVWPPYACDPNGTHYQRHAADLALMTAAPELFEALENLLVDLQEGDEDRNPESGEEYESCIVARELIARLKATAE